MSAVNLQNILYVEDDPTIRELVKLTLEEHGLHAQVCERWDEAVGVIRHFKPDLLLLDVILPEKNGVEALAALRKEAAIDDLPVIFLTVDATLSFPPNVDRQALEPYDILPKPFQIEDLCDDIMARWRNMVA